jgi:peptidoglycan hydrolase CwlO-like protein
VRAKHAVGNVFAEIHCRVFAVQQEVRWHLMTNKKTLWTVVALGVLLLAVGCGGKNVPCDTDPSQIEDAKAELQTAEQQVATAESELASARSQKQNLENQMQSLPDPAELEADLEELKKGSGR